MTDEKASPLKNHGWRSVNVLFLGGLELPIFARFFARNKPRAKKGKGCYPGLVLLGIFERISPATLDLIAKEATALGSMREAKASLADQGIDVSLDRINTAVHAVALQARFLRNDNASVKSLDLKDKKIVVSIDGGRVRLRENKKGPRTAKKRTRYSTEWREPKLLCIYFLDENGGVDRSIPPILDGTMGDADEAYALLELHLSMLGIESDTEILFVADGADWIWKRLHRIERIVRERGGRFTSLLDYYHMKGHLHSFAEAVKGWTKKKRTQWMGRMTKHLFERRVGEFIKEVKAVSRGSRKGSVLRTERNYLVKHASAGHMNYGEARRRKLPIGSGVIESTVRRVVNLRLKGASVYWLVPTAEAMLLLRCLYKANRWQDIENQSFTTCQLAA